MPVVMAGVKSREVELRATALGPALHVKFHAPDFRNLTWGEVWEAFSVRYPGRWAVQVFPPAEQLIDGKAVYHLFVLPEGVEPAGMNLR